MSFKFIEEIIDALFPKKCSNCGLISQRYICLNCKTFLTKFQPECVICRKSSPNWEIHTKCKKDNTLESVRYIYKYDNIIHNLVLSIKYVFHKAKIDEIVLLIKESNEFKDLKRYNIDLISYIPMSKKRQNWRGFNQTELIAIKLSEELQIPCLPLLIKTKHTKAQIDLKREERMINLKSSFQINSNLKVELSNKKILLVDDICTTGSTLEECSKTIKLSFPNTYIYGLCLARGE